MKSIKNIIVNNVTKAVILASTADITPPPATIATEFISFVACAIKSPVRYFWKNEGDILVKCSNNLDLKILPKLYAAPKIYTRQT